MLLRLVLNLCQPFCLSLLSTGISDMCYCALLKIWKQNWTEEPGVYSHGWSRIPNLSGFISRCWEYVHVCHIHLAYLLIEWLLLLFLFWDRVLLCVPQPPNCWDYWCLSWGRVQDHCRFNTRVVGQLCVHSSLQTSQGFMDRHSFPPHFSISKQKGLDIELCVECLLSICKALGSVLSTTKQQQNYITVSQATMWHLLKCFFKVTLLCLYGTVTMDST